jgi:hypothetical protein
MDVSSTTLVFPAITLVQIVRVFRAAGWEWALAYGRITSKGRSISIEISAP